MNEIALKSEFGSEAVLNRLWLSHLECYGTAVAATMVAKETPTETISFAWTLVQQLASWLLQEAVSLPENERYLVIVGWSSSVRPGRGQIFKTGGNRDDLQRIIEAPTSESFTSPEHNPLVNNWQKDMFSK